MGESNPIFAHPQILISMCLGQKWGKKYMEREGKSICFNTLLAYYCRFMPISSHDAPKFGFGYRKM